MHATTAQASNHPHERCSVTVFQTFADDALHRRIRGEFSEMPGMRLTLDQARRLWTLDRDTCAGVLEGLVAARFLEVDLNGRYRKAHCGY